ncbi:MAG: MFS transporter, partial [Thermoplasmata archaeon]|nr:MFS transporter [Thermoplasmata archaeon]
VPPDRLFAANGLLSAASGVEQLAAFVGGAALILLFGPGFAMLLYGALNVLAGALALPLDLPVPATAPAGFASDLVVGWRHLRSPEGRPALELSIFSGMEGFVSSAPPLLIALIAATRFGDPTAAYGVLFASFAIGGAVGGLLLGGANPRRSLAYVLIGATIIEGALIVVSVGVPPTLFDNAPAWFGVGIADIAFYTSTLVYFQATTPAAVLGRTVANAYLLRGGARAAGAVVVGALALTLTPMVLGTWVGLLCVGIGVFGTLALPNVRRLAF